jgi:hypothetical protein
MGHMGRFTSTPYLVLFVILGAIGITTAYAATITLGGDPVIINGILDMMNHRITNVGAPTALSDAATKGYVDSTSGYTFVRWGNPTATGGSTLLYSGFAMDSHYNLAAGTDTICVTQNPTLVGNSANENGALAYFGITQTTAPHSTQIPHNKVIQCSALYSQQPTFVLWGSNSCPSGWSSAYSGIVMSAHYTHSGGGGSRICVDNVSFDSSINAPIASSGALFYMTEVEESTNGFTKDLELTCAVCMKN